MSDHVDKCVECGAKCCRYFCFQIDDPEEYSAFEDIRWFLCHEGISVHIDEDGDWYICIENRCKYVGSDNRCMIYEERPIICRQYDVDGCDFTGGDYRYQKLFTTPEQIEAYAREQLGPHGFDGPRTRARRRIERKQQAKARGRRKRRGK
ncbi:MAG: YkgJ family cysteine cluster protein [Phycisphaerae bacterium]|nr:YkgJ family cysteine cluster protein [Phycisphaerae bacterium]